MKPTKDMKELIEVLYMAGNSRQYAAYLIFQASSAGGKKPALWAIKTIEQAKEQAEQKMKLSK